MITATQHKGHLIVLSITNLDNNQTRITAEGIQHYNSHPEQLNNFLQVFETNILDIHGNRIDRTGRKI